VKNLNENKNELIPVLDDDKEKFIQPAIGLFNNIFYYGFFIPCRERNNGKKVDTFCLVTDNKGIIPVNNGKIEKLNAMLSSNPSKINDSRWSFRSIKEYLDGAPTPNPMEVFLKIRNIYEYYIDFSDNEAYDFFSLWSIGTYIYTIFQSYPYVYLHGMKAVGKSKCIALTNCIVFNAIFSGNMTTPTIFRLIEDHGCTLLIDETEKLSSRERQEDFRNILLNGYKFGARAYRTEEKNNSGSYKVKGFDLYSPKMLANISGLDDVLEGRCIRFILKKTHNKEICNRDIKTDSLLWGEIRDDLYVIALTQWKEIKKIYDELKNDSDIVDRDWELWKPIFAIAKFIGSDLFERMKLLAKVKSTEAHNENVSDTLEYLLVRALLKIVEKDDFYKIKLIRSKMTESYDEEQDCLTHRWIGAALKRLGFIEKRRIGDGTEVRLTVKAVTDMGERLGVLEVDSPCTQSSQNTLGVESECSEGNEENCNGALI